MTDHDDFQALIRQSVDQLDAEVWEQADGAFAYRRSQGLLQRRRRVGIGARVSVALLIVLGILRISGGQKTQEQSLPAKSILPISTTNPCSRVPSSIFPPGEIRVAVQARPAKARIGDRIALSIVVSNDSSRPIEYFHSGQEFDLLIRNEAGEVWRYSDFALRHGTDFETYLKRDTLDSGERRSGTAEWDGNRCQNSRTQLVPGKYFIQGVWLVQEPYGQAELGGWWSPPVEIELQAKA